MKLANEHFVKMKDFEKRKSSELKVRQAVFQEAFEEDLQNYKEGSLVPSMAIVKLAVWLYVIYAIFRQTWPNLA